MTSRRMMSDHVLLGHGGGGLLTRELIESVILPVLDNPLLHPLDDAAILDVEKGKLAFTTDSYVVSPLFFPGGDIGKLAVCGTVNDLAVKGAKPLWMSLGLVLEEGLPLVDLKKVIESVGSAAREAGVKVVTGDTKVVEKGRCDGLYINTAGIGSLVAGSPLGPSAIRPGDAIIVNGFLGDHGVAIMARRSGISFSPEVVSDCACLWDLVRTVLDAGVHVHAMRDLTRGGLAAALCELAGAAGLGLRVWETRLPVRDAVRGACDLLGFEPMAVANEGKMVLFCPSAEAGKVVAILGEHPDGRSAKIVGEVAEGPAGMALVVSRIGGERVIDMPLGEMLPRIC